MNYRQLLTDKQAELRVITEEKRVADIEIGTLTLAIEELKEATEVMNNIMLATQISISAYVEGIVATALQAVLGDEYGFKIQYEIKRNQSEAYLFITRNGEMYNPKDECAGGGQDIAAFGLRVACWALDDKQTQRVLILDEPGTCVSVDMMPKFGEMLKATSELLDLQVIMISHDPVLIESADRAFQVTMKDDISTVEVIR